MKNQIFIAIIFLFLAAGYVPAAPGDVDTTFSGTGKLRLGFKRGDDSANATATQSDGKTIVVGTTPNGDGDFLITRYNTNGSLDGSFGSGGMVMTHFGRGDDVAMGVVIQPNGKIVVTGYCAGANVDVCLARYDTDGTLDPNFGIDGRVVTPVTTSWDYGRAVALQNDGKIVVVGSTLTDNTTADVIVLRYNANGSIDSTFGFSNSGWVITNVSPNHDDIANAVAIQSDGKIVVAGTGDAFPSPQFLIINRYTSTGSLDNTWGLLGGIGMYRFTDTGAHRANAVTIQSDGKPVLAGTADSKFVVVRFTTAGLFDNTFNGTGRVMASLGTNSADEAMSVMTDGSSVTAAGYSWTGVRKNFAIARYSLSGTPDVGFNGGTGIVVIPIGDGDAQINSISMQSGAILAAGSSSNGSNTDFTVTRFTVGGALDNAFAGNGKRIEDPGNRFAPGYATAVQPDGKILVAGSSGTDSNGSDFAVARYNTDGSLDTSFGDNGRVTTDLGSSQEDGYGVAVAPDGKIVVVGNQLDPAANKFDIAVARYNPNGSLDSTFNGTGKLVIPIGSGSDTASGVAVQSDRKIIVVGSTEVVPNVTDFAVLRLTENGTPDNSFGNGGKAITPVGNGSDEAKAVRIQPDGKIVVAGNAYGNQNSAFAAVRYTTGGIPDNTFGQFGRQITAIGTGSDACFGLALQSNGRILLSGYSLGASGVQAEAAVIRYTTAGVLDSSFNGNGIVKTLIGPTVSVATSVSVQNDGKIVIGGGAAFGNEFDFAAARYLENGTLDDTYGIGGKIIVDLTGESDIAWSGALDSQNRLVLTGDAHSLFGIVRLQGDLAPRKTPFDFDGDGKTDISIFRPGPAEWWIAKSAGGSFATQFGASTDKIAPADYTGDGKADIAFFRPSTGQWFVLRSEDSSFFGFTFGTNGDIPMSADYDGDGKADPAVFRPSNSTWYIQKSSGGFTITQFGANGDQPVAADYDGDGKADIAIHRPDGGQWWINRSSGGVIAYNFGNSTDKAVPGDYTGDGKADVAVWRPTTANWFILRSEDASFYGFPFGAAGDLPAPGDYDGDGKFDPTVFRGSSATWFVAKSSGGVSIVPFGAAGDQPLPATYVR